MDKVSIIIVTLNVEDYLQACLTSIEKQTYGNLEVVIVDGGSTDSTIGIIEKNQHIITHWVSEKDNGIYDAMNKALTMITGQWVYFLGADDVLLDDFSAFLKELKDDHAIYYGSVLKENIKYYGKASPYQFAKAAVCHQAIVYPASVFEKYKFDENYITSADYVLNMWCWKDKNYQFEFRDYILANFNHTGASSKKDPLLEKNMLTLVYENFGWVIWLRLLFKKLKAGAL